MKHPYALLSAILIGTSLLSGCASTGTTPASSNEPAPAAAPSEPEPAAVPAAEPECD
ncbi:MAG: hypothetical protein OQK94_06615 [Gammaproteobacteria bacterium]|nr:hypothetical protein [Gammaproteobacteria bacterium]MCW8841680.1 hypothetical protein [Gammaproteobacteria bacterium]MCW8958517.1 hypothetical protein [Gammaproteobacteria bacterium]MCW8973652.1 hypothetical protein [Gammaproteobacteria bacterium]MCW8991680.1 hypothetical protein [Gammaproteobacteria bacterium]